MGYNKILLNIFTTLLVILTLLSIVSIGYSAYYFKHNKKIVINNVNANALSATDPALKEVFPFEVKLFTNKNKNGRYCYDFQVNTYVNGDEVVDGHYKTVTSMGFQAIDKLSLNENVNNNFMGDCYHSLYFDNVDKNSFYYSTDLYSKTSYSALKTLPEYKGFIFDTKVDGKPVYFTLAPRGYKPTYKKWWYMWNQEYFGINMFIRDLESAVASLKDGKHILKMDISKYFTFAIVNNDGTSVESVGGKNTYLDFTMFNIKIEKSSNGLVDSSESLFKQFGANPDYANVHKQDDYFGAVTNYYINEYSFDLTKNDNNTYYLSLKEDIIKFLSTFKGLDIIININLDSKFFDDNYCTGLTLNAFKDLKFKECNISSSTSREFNLNGNTGNFTFSNIEVIGGVE